MKTTVDLPDDLVRKLKLRAVHDGRKLEDPVAELLRRGLADRSIPRPSEQSVIRKDKKTGFPVIQCLIAPAADQQLTPDRIAQVLIDQETQWAHKSA